MDYNKEEFISNKINDYYKNKYRKKQVTTNYKNTAIKKSKKGGFYKIYSNIKNRIYKVFKENDIKFTNSYEEIIGCNMERLEVYIVNKLNSDMTINNYGEWEVDHIFPVSKFDFTNKENIFKCFHYTNLQPLWKDENRKKYNKITV